MILTRGLGVGGSLPAAGFGSGFGGAVVAILVGALGLIAGQSLAGNIRTRLDSALHQMSGGVLKASAAVSVVGTSFLASGAAMFANFGMYVQRALFSFGGQLVAFIDDAEDKLLVIYRRLYRRHMYWRNGNGRK